MAKDRYKRAHFSVTAISRRASTELQSSVAIAPIERKAATKKKIVPRSMVGEGVASLQEEAKFGIGPFLVEMRLADSGDQSAAFQDTISGLEGNN